MANKHLEFANNFQFPRFYTGPKENTIENVSTCGILFVELIKYKQRKPNTSFKTDPLPNISSETLLNIILSIPEDFPCCGLPSKEICEMFQHPNIANNRICSVCNVYKPISGYSSKQWATRASSRKCKDCIDLQSERLYKEQYGDIQPYIIDETNINDPIPNTIQDIVYLCANNKKINLGMIPDHIRFLMIMCDNFNQDIQKLPTSLKVFQIVCNKFNKRILTHANPKLECVSIRHKTWLRIYCQPDNDGYWVSSHHKIINNKEEEEAYEYFKMTQKHCIC